MTWFVNCDEKLKCLSNPFPGIRQVTAVEVRAELDKWGLRPATFEELCAIGL